MKYFTKQVTFSGMANLKAPIPKSILLVLFIFTCFGNSLAQNVSPAELLNQKATLFKYQVEYDSALFYYDLVAEVRQKEGDQRSIILNDLNIIDVQILIRNFPDAQVRLNETDLAIAGNFKTDDEVLSVFQQVKGSYFLAMGYPDSAKSCFYQSIARRTAASGKADTNLHYAYNRLGNLYIALSNYDSAFICHKTALDISLSKKNQINYLTASSYQNVGISAHLRGDFQLAESCYKKSLELKEKLFRPGDPALAKIYWNMGKFYTDLSKYTVALDYYEKSEKLLATKYEREHYQFAHVYWNKGNVYTHLGDYVKATSYLAKAHSILESTYGKTNPEVLRVLLDLGFAYDKMGDTKLAIEYYNKALVNKDNAGIIKIYRNLGNIYMALNERDSAEKYYNASITAAKKVFSGNSYDLALCYQYYGAFLAKSLKDERALWYYNEAAKIFIQLFGNKNKDLSKIYRLQGEYYTDNGEFDSALDKIQSSLVALLPGFSSTGTDTNPGQKDFIIDVYLQETLLQKAYTLYLKHKANSDYNDLKASLEVIDITINVTDEIRKTLNDEENQLILNNLAGSVFDLGVLVAFDIYNHTSDIHFLTKAFDYSEKGQAIILLSALRGLEAQSSSNIPQELRARESYITKELATYNSFLYEERQKITPDQAKIKLWGDEIFNLRLAHDSILFKYQQEHPEYFRLKFDYTTTPAEKILSTLENDQAIIEYCITDSSVMGFLLTENLITAKKLGKKDYLISLLDTLRKDFTGEDFINAGNNELNSLAMNANELYNFLIQPFEDKIGEKRLIIIPDGELGYLSFDLLISHLGENNFTDFRELPWLIRSHPISYSSSATIYFEQSKQTSPSSNHKVLAFAPSYDFVSMQRNAGSIDSALLKLNPMIGTKEEINHISEYFKTRKLFDQEATESYFKEFGGKYGILHLAMHTIIDDENPLYSKLVFTPSEDESKEDGYLNTYELFNLRLKGKLAVLSACNTGSGKLERGEGIISLARGFFYAGIPSVVMTLWEIEDHSSADLMALFYKNLEDGFPNDIALQRAKLSYLENSGKLHSHPYFWAGYVNIGKINTIKSGPWISSKLITIAGFGALLLILAIILFINRRVFFLKKRY